MRDPVILHDHLYKHLPVFRSLFEEVDSGKLVPESDLASSRFILSDGTYARSIHMLWYLNVGYRRCGQQTFVVGPRFREMLSNTSLAGVPRSAVLFPYDYFYVALPDSGLRVWGGRTGWHDLDGVLVGKDTHSGIFTLYLWGKENDKSNGLGDDASFWFNVSPREAESRGEDMEAYASNILADVARDDSDGSSYPLTDPDVKAETEQTLLAVIRVVLNLSVYLQHKGAEKSEHPLTSRARTERARLEGALKAKKNPKKKSAQHLQRGLADLTNARVTWLGESIEKAPTTGALPGTSPSLRFWVRGHWWPRLDNREATDRLGTRWVQPYLKGPDTEATPPRHYRVSGDAKTTPPTK